MPLQAVYEIVTLIQTQGDEEDYSKSLSTKISRTIDRIGEVFSTIIMYHFVLQLQPVVIALNMAQYSTVEL